MGLFYIFLMQALNESKIVLKRLNQEVIMQLSKGQTAPSFNVKDIWGNDIDLSKIENKKILLSFFRYAECAVYFNQIPADFILDFNKEILVAKYGNKVVDHVSLREVLIE